MPVQDTSTASSPFTEPFSSSHSLFTITSITMNSFAISDAAVDQLAVLFRQEETCYRTTDYFTQGNCQLTVSFQEYERQYPTSCNKMKQSDHQCGDNSLLMQWRKATCVWAFRVAKFFGLNREVVTIAMNHLDRYLATVLSKTFSTTSTTSTTSISSTTISKQEFQLWVLTAMYLAIKLNHGCCLYQDRLYLDGTNSTLEAVCQLSDPEPFDAHQIQQMELEMLRALDWHVHPPTPQAFLRLLWNPDMARNLLLNYQQQDQQDSWDLEESPLNSIDNSAQWWHQKVYDQCCNLLDVALEECEISLLVSTSELAISALANVIDDSCDAFTTCPKEQAPSAWLVSQWKLLLPSEFAGKLSTKSIDACRQQLQEFQPEPISTKRRISNCSSEQEVVLVSPPATKKARIRVVPSPACIRDTILM